MSTVSAQDVIRYCQSGKTELHFSQMEAAIYFLE